MLPEEEYVEKSKKENPDFAKIYEEEKRSTSFDNFLREQLKNPEFRREYEAECEKLKKEGFDVEVLEDD